jgi:hypothetical protein
MYKFSKSEIGHIHATIAEIGTTKRILKSVNERMSLKGTKEIFGDLNNLCMCRYFANKGPGTCTRWCPALNTVYASFDTSKEGVFKVCWILQAHELASNEIGTILDYTSYCQRILDFLNTLLSLINVPNEEEFSSICIPDLTVKVMTDEEIELSDKIAKLDTILKQRPDKPEQLISNKLASCSNCNDVLKDNVYVINGSMFCEMCYTTRQPMQTIKKSEDKPEKTAKLRTAAAFDGLNSLSDNPKICDKCTDIIMPSEWYFADYTNGEERKYCGKCFASFKNKGTIKDDPVRCSCGKALDKYEIDMLSGLCRDCSYKAYKKRTGIV